MPQDHSVTQAERLLPGTSKNWLRVLDAYHVQFLVLNFYSESDVVKYFRSLPGWLVDFEDQELIIFTRTDVPTYAHEQVFW